MKVENPQFKSLGVRCSECPLEDDTGSCFDWLEAHDNYCPRDTKEYQAACRLAEEGK